MKKTYEIMTICIVIILVLMAISMGQCSKIGTLKDELEQQKENVKILKQGETEYRLKDSTLVTEIHALQLDKKQFEELILAKDKQIEQIKNERKKEIEYYSKLTKHDSLYITLFDTIFVGKDTCFSYDDGYMSLTTCKGFAEIETTDTIKQVISAEYKHKFLWWKWGLKGITQDIWSANPHSNIHFDEFVKLTK